MQTSSNTSPFERCGLADTLMLCQAHSGTEYVA
jgi:hypothetical protein